MTSFTFLILIINQWRCVQITVIFLLFLMSFSSSSSSPVSISTSLVIPFMNDFAATGDDCERDFFENGILDKYHDFNLFFWPSSRRGYTQSARTLSFFLLCFFNVVSVSPVLNSSHIFLSSHPFSPYFPIPSSSPFLSFLSFLIIFSSKYHPIVATR